MSVFQLKGGSLHTLTSFSRDTLDRSNGKAFQHEIQKYLNQTPDRWELNIPSAPDRISQLAQEY